MFNEENVIYRYKYLPYTEWSLKTITDSTIKFTCPLDFNDPFDCRPYYDITNIKHLPRMHPDLFKAAGDRMGLTPAKRIQEKGKFLARLKSRIDTGDFAKKFISRVGVVCLSRNALSIPMWSHYADFHRGFVLEFRIPVKIKNVKKDIAIINEHLFPFPVQYRKERPRISIEEVIPDEVDNLVLTKSIDWEYEEEERVIDHHRGPGIHHYRRDEILCSVIAGMNIENKNYVELKSILKELENNNHLNIPMFRIHEKIDEYKLIVNDHPRLQLISS